MIAELLHDHVFRCMQGNGKTKRVHHLTNEPWNKPTKREKGNPRFLQPFGHKLSSVFDGLYHLIREAFIEILFVSPTTSHLVTLTFKYAPMI